MPFPRKLGPFHPMPWTPTLPSLAIVVTMTCHTLGGRRTSANPSLASGLHRVRLACLLACPPHSSTNFCMLKQMSGHGYQRALFGGMFFIGPGRVAFQFDCAVGGDTHADLTCPLHGRNLPR